MKQRWGRKSTQTNPLFSSAITPSDLKNEVLEILGLLQDQRHSKYLDLPSVIGKSKKEVFEEVKERVGEKLSGWKERMLFSGGKEILIKAVA